VFEVIIDDIKPESQAFLEGDSCRIVVYSRCIVRPAGEGTGKSGRFDIFLKLKQFLYLMYEGLL
jgi:hypothetical protein